MSKIETQPTLKGLIEKVQSGDAQAEALLYLYLKEEAYPKLKKYLLNWGGHQEDAQDFFQEAVVVLINAIKEQKFKLSSLSLRSQGNQLAAYLMSVTKNLWRKELRWRKRDPIPQSESVEEKWSMDLSTDLIQDAFESLGEDCQQLLKLYFKDNYSPRVIASKLGKKTEAIKTQLSSCIENLLKDIGYLLGEEHQGQLLKLMQKGMEDLEERCQTILQLFYFEKLSMTELAEKLGYANAHSVTEQKRRCMIRLNHAVVKNMMKKD